MTTIENTQSNDKKVSKYAKDNERRLRFKDKRIHLEEIPRTGKCVNCGTTGKTHIHHDQYIDGQPLACTRELCVPCHYQQTKADFEARTGKKWGVHFDPTITDEVKICEQCGIEFKRGKERPVVFRRKKYCSNKCRNIFLSELGKNNKIINDNRRCYCCDAPKTGDWYLNKPTDLVICLNCHRRVIQRRGCAAEGSRAPLNPSI